MLVFNTNQSIKKIFAVSFLHKIDVTDIVFKMGTKNLLSFLN